MNKTLNNETKAAAMPFPSHVKEAAPNQDVQAVAREIVETSRDLNNLFDTAGNVHKLVRAHYIDTQSGIYGIERLIAAILTERQAVFPKGIEETEFRKVAIPVAMFASEIIEAVQQTFGKERYPYATIHCYLSNFMTKANSQNKVGKIKLTNLEDKSRNCCKPRTKFYLIEG